MYSSRKMIYLIEYSDFTQEERNDVYEVIPGITRKEFFDNEGIFNHRLRELTLDGDFIITGIFSGEVYKTT